LLEQFTMIQLIRKGKKGRNKVVGRAARRISLQEIVEWLWSDDPAQS